METARRPRWANEIVCATPSWPSHTHTPDIKLLFIVGMFKSFHSAHNRIDQQHLAVNSIKRTMFERDQRVCKKHKYRTVDSSTISSTQKISQQQTNAWKSAMLRAGYRGDGGYISVRQLNGGRTCDVWSVKRYHFLRNNFQWRRPNFVCAGMA